MRALDCQDLANFLLLRGDFAWLGYSWIGCSQTYIRPPQMDWDFGVPVDAQCTEVAPNSGVFSRRWSKAMVSMDCNTWQPSIIML